jgi:ubiquinone/menaquinone biosynthesis C-methylase UbiE
LIGVDISKEMIVGAKANFDSLGLGKRAEFKEGPADHLPFEDRT